jgi:hypothetical protein
LLLLYRNRRRESWEERLKRRCRAGGGGREREGRWKEGNKIGQEVGERERGES